MDKKMLQKRRAIFLDRDGTIIVHRDNLIKKSEVALLSYASGAIKQFKKWGFLVIVITNQPVISRGWLTPQELENIHAFMIKKFAVRGSIIDAIYFCPHHPDGNISPYNIDCACRKPKPGMLLKAIRDFDIDPKKSFMIGDSKIDIVAGKRIKMNTVLVKTGPGHIRLDKKYFRTKPDFTAKNLAEASRFIKRVMTS